jgi:putative ABC transport system permease protein
VVAELGFVLCAPALVGLAGRLARRLPLPLRLAARDAARHRTRSGPAVAAVVAAVAGSIAVSVYLASNTERGRRAYQPSLPVHGAVQVGQHDPDNPVADADIARIGQELHATRRIDFDGVGAECGRGPQCYDWRLAANDCAEGGRCFESIYPWIAVSNADYVEFVSGARAKPVDDALAEGKAVVFDPNYVQDGYASIERIDTTTGRAAQSIRVPALLVVAPAFNGIPGGMLTQEAARALHLPLHDVATAFLAEHVPPKADEARARGVVLATTPYLDLTVERGFRSDNGVPLLVLLVVSSVVTLGATGIATGLAAVDSRPDLATFAAVGAGPGTRRVLAMSQAAMVAGLGSALGLLAGLVPSIAVVAARAEIPLAMPWGVLAATVLGVPILAALAVGAVTRSRLPMERRLA